MTNTLMHKARCECISVVFTALAKWSADFV